MDKARELGIGGVKLTAMATGEPNLLDVRFDSGLILTVYWIVGTGICLGGATPVALLELDAMFVEGDSMSEGAHDVVCASEAKLDSANVADRVHGIPIDDGLGDNNSFTELSYQQPKNSTKTSWDFFSILKAWNWASKATHLASLSSLSADEGGRSAKLSNRSYAARTPASLAPSLGSRPTPLIIPARLIKYICQT
jgi:hypothetical protein